MTDEELNLGVARKLGWKDEKRKRYAGEDNVKGIGLNQHLHPGDIKRQFIPFNSLSLLPNYSGDLNEIHKAWLTLGEQLQWEYCNELSKVIERHFPGEDCYRQRTLEANATARQRAEAFVNLRELWEPN